MKRLNIIVIAVLAMSGLTTAPSHAQTEDDASILRLLTCQDSWMDWKNDAVKQQKFVDTLKASFKRNDRDGSYLPVKPMSILGHDVFQLYPQSVGMGLGYSVIVNASFETVKARLEKQMGKPFDSCQAASEGKSCEREVAKQRTVMLMEGSRGANPKTLFGCYYLYEK